MSFVELKEKIAHLERRNITSVKFHAELYKRINLSFSALTFIVLGFGVSLVVRHREKSINFLTAFVTTGFYYILLVLGNALAESAMIAPLLGMSFPNISALVVGGFLFIKNAYIR